ncbi:MAG: rhomboid family intramembrane serine protease [Solirubrobacteraceae bacterium]
MTSGADLFVVCKQCGSEVSPYITECPYCGNRLRRRAPKLPRAHAPSGPAQRRAGLSSLLRRSKPVASGRMASASRRVSTSRWDATRPYATIALVAAGALAWIVFHAEPSIYFHMAIIGPLDGEWWKLITSAFAYVDGVYAAAALATVALFGWLMEQRHGPVIVLALFVGGAVVGALVACAVYPVPVADGGNAAALALLAAWAAPDLRAARAGSYYEGDLLGVAAVAAFMLVFPFARIFSEASWLAGVAGAALGLLVGLGLDRGADRRA